MPMVHWWNDFPIMLCERMNMCSCYLIYSYCICTNAQTKLLICLWFMYTLTIMYRECHLLLSFQVGGKNLLEPVLIKVWELYSDMKLLIPLSSPFMLSLKTSGLVPLYVCVCSRVVNHVLLELGKCYTLIRMFSWCYKLWVCSTAMNFTGSLRK